MTDQSQSLLPGTPRTVAEALGQIVWLLAQSPLHGELTVKEVEQTLLPAVMCEQFRLFRLGPLPGLREADSAALSQFRLTPDGLEQMPLGVAVWATLSEEAEGRLEDGETLRVEDWRSGDRVWLVELVSPFATPENRLAEVMLLDLAQGPFKATAFNLHRTDPATGRREKVRIASHLQPAPVPQPAV
jgi:cytolysin-activating lysine-acyltransferase